jgi:hypothetical protein
VTGPGDGEVGWRIRSGAGLLSAAPLNAELREAHRKEDERERRAAELEAQLRADAVLDRKAELLRQGHVPRTQEEFLAQVGWAQDRQDAVDAQREKAAAELLGKPVPRLDKYQMKAEAAEREKAKETAPATQADVSKLSQSITSLASKVGMMGRRRSAEQVSPGAPRRRESPEKYARAYGSGVRFRNGGPVVRGPY